MKVRVCTRRYVRSHGKSPRGFGGWAVSFDGGETSEFVPGSQHFGTAKQWAVLEAKRRGAAVVTVMP